MKFLLSIDLVKATAYLRATSVELHSQFINHSSNDNAQTVGHGRAFGQARPLDMITTLFVRLVFA